MLHPDVKEMLISNEEIIEKCKELGKKISEEYEGKRPILIGLLKGSVPFMAELMKHITCEMQIDFMAVSSYEGTTTTGMVHVSKDVSADVTNRHILIVEDIIDTGITLDCVQNMFKERKVASIEMVTLLDKPERRKVNTVSPKYVCFTIPNEFVIGYGLDYNELYRNLPYVGVLKPSVYEK